MSSEKNRCIIFIIINGVASSLFIVPLVLASHHYHFILLGRLSSRVVCFNPDDYAHENQQPIHERASD